MNKRMENNRARHTNTTGLTCASRTKKNTVYLPYSLCVLQRAGRARPWFKNDTHDLTFPSTSEHTHIKPHTHPLGHLELSDQTSAVV